jgi:dTDP-4-dehydrorhamnose 3,5-epimerase
MRFIETAIAGAFLVEPEPASDERGFFARTWCRQTFADFGLESELVQCNVSFNRRSGTLRGMHYQIEPYGEVKLVRVTQGAIYDVLVDLRGDSATYKQWAAFELSASNRHALYIPRGIAHGFQTLADESEVFYQMSTVYEPAAARGVRWNDPAFGIAWPVAPQVISTRDAAWPWWCEPASTTAAGAAA